MEGSHEHLLIWMRDFYSLFIEPCHIFSEGLSGSLEDIGQASGSHFFMFVGGEVLYHLPG